MAAVGESPVSCDTALSAMMDDLEEGTLLSLLEDRELFSYLDTLPMTSSIGGSEQEVEDNDLDLSELFGDDLLLPDYFPAHSSNKGNPRLVDIGSKGSEATVESLASSSSSGSIVKDPLSSPVTSGGSESDISTLDSNDSDSAPEESPSLSSGPTKRRKVDTIGRAHDDRSYLTMCVEHDHCYTRVSSSERLLSPGGSPVEKETPHEEDTGESLVLLHLNCTTNPHKHGTANSHKHNSRT